MVSSLLMRLSFLISESNAEFQTSLTRERLGCFEAVIESIRVGIHVQSQGHDSLTNELDHRAAIRLSSGNDCGVDLAAGVLGNEVVRRTLVPVAGQKRIRPSENVPPLVVRHV